MNKTELIKAVAKKTALTKKDAEKAVNAFLDVVVEEVAKGDSVQLIGFGTFETARRGEREGRNPQTGENMMIPASVLPKFKPGKSFKDAVRK